MGGVFSVLGHTAGCASGGRVLRAVPQSVV